MSRCMIFAALLYDPHRSLSKVTLNDDGSVDEALNITPGQVEVILREMTPAQRAFYDSPVPAVRPLVNRWSGKSHYYATMRAIRETIH